MSIPIISGFRSQKCLFVYFQFRERRWRILSNSTKPRVHGSHWKVICQPDCGRVPDGGGQQGGGGGAGVRVLQLPLRDGRGEHQLQRQHLPALRLHHVQAAAGTLTTILVFMLTDSVHQKPTFHPSMYCALKYLAFTLSINFLLF